MGGGHQKEKRSQAQTPLGGTGSKCNNVPNLQQVLLNKMTINKDNAKRDSANTE